MPAFNYSIQVTGDCQNNNSGSIQVGFSGGTPPYTVQWINPNGGGDVYDYLVYDYNYIDPLNPYLTFSVLTGLSAKTYTLRVNDSTLPLNLEYDVNVPVSSGNCCSIVSLSSTTCNQNNGTVTVQDSSDYSSTWFYLYTFNGTLVDSGTTDVETYTFENLSAGTYYVEAVDIGGCTGTSQSFIVNPSVVVDYGFYPVDDTQCGAASGRIIITGQTGVPPWTYQWSDGQTGSTITGLTAGTYSVKVTDATGCSKIKSQSISQIDPVGLGGFVVDQIPGCLTSDGVITMTITGGTGPYYYSASTGDIEVSYSKSFQLSGVPVGSYNFMVTDAALCKFNAGIDLASPNGISDIIVDVKQSTCSNATGAISVTVIGGISPFTYNLIYPDASLETLNSNAASFSFENLSGGTYTVSVSDSNGCYYNEEVLIISDNIFTITGSTTGTTCSAQNGIVKIQKSSGGVPPFDYFLDNTQSILDTSASAVTFTNVSSGQHQIKVVDSLGCTQVKQVFVNPSIPTSYNMYASSGIDQNSGKITTFISNGVPPFDFEWSDNVSSNPQQITVTGLSAGTYSVTITDSEGCSLSRQTEISIDAPYVSYQTYLVGEETFSLVTGTKRGLLQMLNEGFDELTSSNTNCQLVSAIFVAQVQVQPLGIIVDQSFYTSTSLTDGPSDNLWFNSIETLLEGISGIQSVTLDPLTSEITIKTDPSNPSLTNQEIIVELIIIYDIMCLT